MNIRISVLLATYNGSKYLEPLLQSLKDQTCLPHEVIACDDCSIDSTLDILLAFQANSGIPVRIIRNQRNLGYISNFINGIQYCEGDYVAFCDQDDIWLPEKLHTVCARITQFPKGLGMVFSDSLLVDEKGKSLGLTGFEYLQLSDRIFQQIEEGNMLDVLLKRTCVSGMTMVCNRHLLAVSPPPLDASLPYDYLISAAFAATNSYAMIRKPLVLYRQHESNVIGMRNARKPRLKFTCSNYETIVNKELVEKLQLIRYCLEFIEKTGKVNEHKKRLLLDAQELCLRRYKMRYNLFGILSAYPTGGDASITKSEQRRLKLKDIRVYLRIKMHRLLNLMWRIR